MPTPADEPASLIGSQVSHVRFDNQTTLNLFHQEDGGAIWDADLTIFTPFVLRSADGTTHHLDPETSRAALAPVIDLLATSITGLTVDGDDSLEYDVAGNPINALGTLIVDFADGAQLTVPPHPTYEPWLLDYRDLGDDEEPERRIRWRLHQPRLRRLRLRRLRRRGLRGGGGFKPRSRGQRGWWMRTAELSRSVDKSGSSALRRHGAARAALWLEAPRTGAPGELRQLSPSGDFLALDCPAPVRRVIRPPFAHTIGSARAQTHQPLARIRRPRGWRARTVDLS